MDKNQETSFDLKLNKMWLIFLVFPNAMVQIVKALSFELKKLEINFVSLHYLKPFLNNFFRTNWDLLNKVPRMKCDPANLVWCWNGDAGRFSRDVARPDFPLCRLSVPDKSQQSFGKMEIKAEKMYSRSDSIEKFF